MNRKWLEMKNVEIRIKNKSILKNISLNLREEEHSVVIGPNGSGKSSLINTIAKVYYPIVRKETFIHLFEKDLISIWELRKAIGFVMRDIDARISSKLSVIDVVISGYYGCIGINNNVTPHDSLKEKGNYILNKLHLTNFTNSYYKSLSDGQKRKVLIARAIINNPKVLIIDEPTVMLDIKASCELINLMRDLADNNTTLLYMTNTLDNIIPEIKKVIFIKNGQLINYGPPKEMITSNNLSKLFDTQLTVYKVGDFWRCTPTNSKIKLQSQRK